MKTNAYKGDSMIYLKLKVPRTNIRMRRFRRIKTDVSYSSPENVLTII